MSEEKIDLEFQKRSEACDQVEARIKEYVDEYEFDDGESSHMPTELESFLIYDAIHGLLADDEFIAKFTGWKALCVDRKAALQVENTPEQEQSDYTPAEDAAFDKGWEAGLARGRRYAQAIETAAIMRVLKEVEECEQYPAGYVRRNVKASDIIRALITQGGWTKLRELMIASAEKSFAERAMVELFGNVSREKKDALIALYVDRILAENGLIGVPPLNSEMVSGEKK